MERSSELYIPSTTAMERVNRNNRIDSFQVYLQPGEDNQLWQDRVVYLLMKKFNFSSKSASGINVWSDAKYANQFKSSANMFKYLLLGIGAISLLV